MKTNCLLTVLGAALLLSSLAAPLRGENPQFRERLAAWQTPPVNQPDARHGVRPAAWEEEPIRSPSDKSQSRFVEESVDEWTGDSQFADGNDPSCCPDRCGRCMDWTLCGNRCGPRLWWLRKDGLLFWRKGRDLPPLVTTSDTPVPPSGTTVLFGDRTETSSARIGGRFDFGTWLSFDECVGIGGRYWYLDNDQSTFALDSADLPGQTIERPFIQSPDTPNSLVIADPFTGFDGSIRIAEHSEAFGADAYIRIRCYQSCLSRTDFVTGYQFARINESLRINSSTQNAALVVSDNYVTSNEFQGGILGVIHDYDFGCVNLLLSARVGLGNMRQTATATGQTNGQEGGLLVENNATLVRNKFCSAPEFGATLGYQFSPCMQVSAGYTFLYWSNVARPEDLIDNVRGDGASFVFRDSSFWIQGFHAGLTLTF
ncbi:MAG: BBP7 family outer membrane beta-barrel protein [Pirellulaceae bacterium]